MYNKIIHGDCIEEMKKLKESSIDAIITDPPYGIGFMGKEWDSFKEYKEKPQTERTKRIRYYKPNGEPVYWFQPTYLPKNFKFMGKNQDNKNQLMENFFYIWAIECLRVLKPGGFLLSFGGTRTYHRMASGIEDAGFEIRDIIMWLYGSGFPKSLNIGKQIDKINKKYDEDFTLFGNYVRECREKKGLSRNEVEEELKTNTALAWWEGRNYLGKFIVQLPNKKHYQELKELLGMDNRFDKLIDWQEAEREITGKDGRGELKEDMFFTQDTKKAFESGKSIGYGKWDLKDKPATPEAKEWEGWGTALKPACEPIVVARKPLSEKNVALNVLKHGTGGINIDESRIGTEILPAQKRGNADVITFQSGGFTEERQGRFPANIILDEEAGKMFPDDENEYGGDGLLQQNLFGNTLNIPESKSASRFFYCAKASKSERNFGLDGFEDKESGMRSETSGQHITRRDGNDPKPTKNNHPTVKPIELMEYLIKLVSKEGFVVLDPFVGSGTTAIACAKLNRQFIGIEKEEEYIKIAEARIKPYLEQTKLK